MGFIETFFKRNPTDITANDIESFISRKIEESQNLDYKDIKKYDDADGLSKHISAFANSLGGLLILGVSEKKEGKGKDLRIYPDGITWGDETHSKETLENKLTARIQPSIRELRIAPIRESKESASVVFLIDIPRSNDAPHMAFDKRYHTRMNFRTRIMQHYEVASLFKVNWLEKEKLIEKIFEPMTSVLEKQAGEFREYRHSHSQDLQNILANTYYRLQIPGELLDRIDHYIHAINEYRNGLFYARKAISRIYTKTIMEFLVKEQPDLGVEIRIELRSISDAGTTGLNRDNTMDLLLRNQSLEDYLNEDVYDSTRVHTIEISYPTKEGSAVFYKNEELDLDKFVQFIWKKCLREISDDAKISQMKKDAELLIEEAWDLIDEITKY